jgi:hypothetical protein
MMSEVHFPLYGADSSAHSTRHLRQVENIWCVNDGQYAIVLCSDNTILIFSNSKLFDFSYAPSKCIGEMLESSGFLTLWFQSPDTFQIYLSIGYKCANINLQSGDSNVEYGGNPLADDLRICIGWFPAWKNPNKRSEFVICANF